MAASPERQEGGALYETRDIILTEEILKPLASWHGGQDSYTYSLLSTGRTSMEYLEGAIRELNRDKKALKFHKGYTKKDRLELRNLISELEMLSEYPEEFTAKSYGLENPSFFSNPMGAR